jgi:hypothetical protein
MAGNAECLPIGRIPEQVLITPVWYFVIDHLCQCVAEYAEAIGSQERDTGVVPVRIVSALTGRRAGCVMTCIPGAG